MTRDNYKLLKVGDEVHVYQGCLLRKTFVQDFFQGVDNFIKFDGGRVALWEDVYILPRDAAELHCHMESDADSLRFQMKEIAAMVEA